MSTLTARQSEIVVFIRDFVAVKGFSPTAAEIGAWIGITQQGVVGYLDRLEALGALSRVPGGGRTIKLKKQTVKEH